MLFETGGVDAGQCQDVWGALGQGHSIRDARMRSAENAEAAGIVWVWGV
jgi:hypothetical protein